LNDILIIRPVVSTGFFMPCHLLKITRVSFGKIIGIDALKVVMRLIQFVSLLFAAALFFSGCSRKQYAAPANVEVKKAETKTVVRKVPKTPTPKIITVDDRAAKKTPDGRMYYDLGGKRYWKNFDDGKYYLYNKTMYNEAAFKPH